jgi:hypothetical protein
MPEVVASARRRVLCFTFAGDEARKIAVLIVSRKDDER